jgi:hypothetical protein
MRSVRLLLVALGALSPISAALLVPSAASAASTEKVPATSPQQELEMIQHVMPIMEPCRYEAVLRAALEPQGSLLRWYIGSVDEASGTATAECVLLPREQ